MESRLVKLKTDFNNIISIRNTVKNIFDVLQTRINRLKLMYSEFIKSSKNDMFVFGLDSFHFQSKLIDIEYDDMKRLFLAINNRMYCEYFKLHRIIVEYITQNIEDKKVHESIRVNNYPTYRDLEPFKEYKFELVLEIHENILNLLSFVSSVLTNKENELSIHKTKQNIGLNIDNFITTFHFNNIVMREKIIMFITYIEYFHKMHTKYLKRFSNKIQLMYTHINTDIQFDETIVLEQKKIEKHPSTEEDISDLSTGPRLQQSPSIDTTMSFDKSGASSEVSTSSNTMTQAPPMVYSLIQEDEAPLSPSVAQVPAVKSFQLKTKVEKVSNLLHLYKSNNGGTKFNDSELCRGNHLDDMFSDIEYSCNSIIHDAEEELPTLPSVEQEEETDSGSVLLEPSNASESESESKEESESEKKEQQKKRKRKKKKNRKR